LDKTFTNLLKFRIGIISVCPYIWVSDGGSELERSRTRLAKFWKPRSLLE